tara:strand:- start:27 stop:956 length:930 start_codon:yes stop_codon:yes gene_type:complete
MDNYIINPCNIYYYIKKFIYLLIIILVISVILLLLSYLYIKKYYSKYSQLSEILKDVRGNNKNYMNYGYWVDDTDTLQNANEKLCDLVFKRGDLLNTKNILDVGCGYGEQDIQWCNKTKAKLTSIDIDEDIIDKAKTNIKNNGLSDRINVLQGNACELQFSDETFERVTSVESAFHYLPRINFLKEAFRVLKKNGKFVIADILLSDNNNISYLNKLYQNAFSNIFNIPNDNLITKETFKTQLEDIGFKNVDILDITSNTFAPYYRHFFKNIETKGTLNCIIIKFLDFFINKLCNGTECFSYVVVTCDKQ